MDDKSVLRELAFEANTKYVNAAYRNGCLLSFFILLRFASRAFANRRANLRSVESITFGKYLAFSSFKNERKAIEEHIERSHGSWDHIQLDLEQGTGLDFVSALKRGPRLLPRFMFCLVSQYGLGALRRWAHPFLGYLVYSHLRQKFRQFDSSYTVITTNMSHPVSLGIHFAARDANLRTIFLEHAMTPSAIARDHGYDRMLVRAPHTRKVLIGVGVPGERIELLTYWETINVALPVDAFRTTRIGIAVNDLDEFSVTASLVERLVHRGIRCEIRVHDSDKRLRAFRRLGSQLGVGVSNAAASNILAFIGNHDLIIVGNSGVLLDCLRAKVPVIYFWSGPKELFDYYGLVEQSKCPFARSLDEVIDLLAS